MSKPKLKPLADTLASKGRNGDTMIMHVNPLEVDFLRQVARGAGGDLTTNPDTGAPEAFFFVPMLAGLAGNALGLGTLGSAALSGLATTAMTGDINKGLVAGLTGGAMGTLANGLQGFGQTAADTAAQAGASGVQAGADTAMNALNGAAPSLGGAPMGAMGQGMPGVQDVGMDALNGAAPTMGATSLPTAPPLGIPGASTFAPSASQAGSTFEGLGNALKDPAGAFDHLMANNPAAMRMAGTGLAMGASMIDPKKPERKTYSPAGLSYRTSSYTGGEPSKFGYANTKYFKDETRKFAAGGSAGLGFTGGASGAPTGPAGVKAAWANALVPKLAMIGAGQTGMPPLQEKVMRNIASRALVPSAPSGLGFSGSVAARESFPQLMERSMGNALRGTQRAAPDAQLGGTGASPGAQARGYNTSAQESPFGYANTKWFNFAGGGSVVDPMAEHGDGTADQTPAMIDGVQPAALGSGEYVIRSDVVSGLGNGSTMAGVRALDDMQQRVLAQYRGNAKAAPAKVKPKKVMPK